MDGVSSLMPHFARGGPWRRHSRKRSPRRTAYQLLRGGPGACAAGSSRRLHGYGRGEVAYVRLANASGVHAASARSLA
jgi:hypothetical protein